jgi:hypothetical protein
MVTVEGTVMKNEVRLLNLLCVVAALLFIGFAVVNAVRSPQLLTTDNLFVTLVCLLMALVFAVNPLLYLKSEGKLPIPFKKREELVQLPGTAPPLLDAKGRAVPPDVSSMVANMRPTQAKDAS